jgi:hypothetical protein
MSKKNEPGNPDTRVCWLMLASIGAGVLMGLTAAVAGGIPIEAYWAAALVGGGTGFACSPLMVLGAYYKRARVAVPLIVAPTLVATALAAVFLDPAWMVVSLAAYFSTSMLARFGLSDVHPHDPVPGRCAWCDYDMAGAPSGTCPECGRSADGAQT